MMEIVPIEAEQCKITKSLIRPRMPLLSFIMCIPPPINNVKEANSIWLVL